MKDIKKYAVIETYPDILYKALTNPQIIQLWSGEPAIMSNQPQTEFSWLDGNIVGINLEFEEDKKIVQEWFFDDDHNPSTEKSIVTFKLHPHPKGTSLEIRHTGIPDEAYEDMNEGWDAFFIPSLQDFFENDLE
jgi:activator of HSP90 ATPase